MPSAIIVLEMIIQKVNLLDLVRNYPEQFPWYSETQNWSFNF